MNIFEEYLFEELKEEYARTDLTAEEYAELMSRFAELGHLEEVKPYLEKTYADYLAKCAPEETGASDEPAEAPEEKTAAAPGPEPGPEAFKNIRMVFTSVPGRTVRCGDASSGLMFACDPEGANYMDAFTADIFFDPVDEAQRLTVESQIFVILENDRECAGAGTENRK